MTSTAKALTVTEFGSGTTGRFPHIPALDGLRGIAILWVILHNAPSYALSGKPNVLVWLVAVVAAVGWIGVQLFFVLSGFLITSNLLDSQPATNYYQVFFARRVLRIFPLYYLALLVGLVVVPLVFADASEPGSSRTDQIWLWTFLFNWAHPLGTAALGFPHFWSLAVEEQFYLAWPFVVHKLAPQKLLKICLLVATTALLVRTAMRLYGANSEMIYEFTICRMDALAIGAAAATLLRIPAGFASVQQHAPKLLPSALTLAVTGALSTWAYSRDTLSTQTIGHLILAIFFALVILACVANCGSWNLQLQKFLRMATLRSVGKYSYGMYVLHFPIVQGMTKLLPQFQSQFGKFYSIPLVAIITLLTYIAGALSYHLMEKHFLGLKRLFQPTQILARSGPPIDHA